MNEMRNLPIREILIETLKKLEDCFDKKEGELAYLALTSKPELPFRDRFAFELHRNFVKKEWIVAREWVRKKRRMDIAILDGHKAKALVQLKTWSLFTFVDQASAHFGKIKGDFAKCKGVSNSEERYSLLLATQIDRMPDEIYEEVIKYRSRPNGGWKKAFNRYGTAEGIEDAATKEIRKELKQSSLIVVDTGKVSSGKAFEVNVSVLWWLIQKK